MNGQVVGSTIGGLLGALLGVVQDRFWRRPRRRRRILARLPASNAEVPILGFKAARLHVPSFRFVPLTYGVPGTLTYGVDDDARCAIPAPLFAVHRAPQPGCTCGFYALRSGDTHALVTAPFLLEVELSGTVVVHEHGFRAEHQRVLHVWLGLCAACQVRRANVVAVDTSALDDFEALGDVDYDPITAAYTLCDACAVRQSPLARWEIPAHGRSAVLTYHGGGPNVIAWRSRTMLRPDEVAARIGVPVSEGVPPAA